MKRTPSRGGYRPGAGRKSGSGAFGEPTIRLSIPQSRLATVLTFLDQCWQGKRVSFPARQR
jgi:DNA polymerase V